MEYPPNNWTVSYSHGPIRKFFFDVALDLLKRDSDIVWDPGRFVGLLRGGDVTRLGNPLGAPALGLTP